MIVEVEELPEAKAESWLYRSARFDELLKITDALLKPVLLNVERDKNTYCAIDGITRYQYTINFSQDRKWRPRFHAD